MQGPWIRALKAMLWFVSASHIVIGAGINLFEGMLPLMAVVYGAQVSWTPEFTYILKPLGAFMFALGLIAAAAALDPLRYRPVVYAFVTLFGIRCLQRLVYGQELLDVFAIGWGRNLLNFLFFAGCAGFLVLCERRATREAGA